MRKFLIAPFLVLLKFVFTSFFGIPWLLFDPLLALVVIYTFFHSMDARDFLIYAFFCGFCQDLFGFDIFGIHMFSYPVCAFVVALISRIIYRHNRFFVFPIVFAAGLFNDQIIIFLKLFLPGTTGFSFSGWFLFRVFIEALGTTGFSYLLYRSLQKCASELTE